MNRKDDRDRSGEFEELEDLDANGGKLKDGLIQRASQRILEYWQRRTYRTKTGSTLTLIELEVERVQGQRKLERELEERFDEPGIGERKSGLPFTAYLVYPLLGLLVVAVPVAFVMKAVKGKAIGAPPKRETEAVLPIGEGEFTDQSAREVADAFLRAGTLEERLALVRDPDEVRVWLAEAVEEARAFPIVFTNLSTMGLASANGEARFHRYGVQMPDGGMRLLCVVQTSRGPLVDYEAFARHGSARWEELLEGAAAEELRVFVRASTYYQFEFADERKWRAFELTSPDWPQAMTGYALVSSDTTGTLRKIVGSKLKQRVIVKVRPEGESFRRRQVVIEKVVASGWVRTVGDIESRWLLHGKPAAEQ